MRGLLAFLLGLVALVLTAAATPALWIERNVVDEAGYVALADPLGNDPEFQQALSTVVVDSVVEQDGLSDQLQSILRPVLTQVAQNLTELDGYSQAWTRTSRLSHRANFAPDAEGDVVLNIAPLAELVVDEGAGPLAEGIPVPSSVPISIGGEQARDALDLAATTDPRAWYAAAGAVLAALLCIVVARRSSVAVLWLGLGAIVVAGLLKASVLLGVPELARRQADSSLTARQVTNLVGDAAASSFDPWLLVLAAGGAVLLVLGFVGRVVTGRRQPA